MMSSNSALLRALPLTRVRGKLRRPLSSSLTPELNNLNNTGDNANNEFKQILIQQGFPPFNCDKILSELPNERLNIGELHKTLASWASLQFGEEKMIHLLSFHPGLLLASPCQISKSYSNLSSVFTQNYVFKVLYNSPNVVEQKRSEVAEKLNYLNHTLGIPNSEIVNSSTLSHSITHLKLRSEFLKRCGLLKPPSRKKDEVTTVVDLGDMFDSADEHFAKKVAKLTPLEFEVFSNLYSMEIESDSASEYDSD